MNLRPRCREWLPLSTQQLRLRNLVRIQGVNIEGKYKYNGHDTFIYYTLHNSKESDAFYMSEALPQRHLQQKWVEIQCCDMLKSNANCVCVKVWMTIKEVTGTEDSSPINTTPQLNQNKEQNKEPISALTRELSNTSLSPYRLPRPPDQLLFTWGVYFSGLMQFNQQLDAKCKPNSLIFHMNGTQFSAPEQFTTESLLAQLKNSYEFFSTSMPLTTQTNCHEFTINSPQISRSSSPMAMDWQNDLLHISHKTRYIQLHINRLNVRKSYDLERLLQIQEKQRLRLQWQRESEDIVTEIKQISLHCITKEQLLRKPRTTSLTYHHNQHNLNHSMGRALSVLLAEQQQINPLTLLHARNLLQQIESLRCKRTLLQTERATYAKRCEQHKEHLTALIKAREELLLWLQERKETLENEKKQLQLHYEEHMLHMRRKRAIVLDVERSMTTLCIELSEIYPIAYNGTHYTICDIAFPNMETYLSDVRYANSACMENITAMALSAALGYVAHLVQMVAVIMNRPLRNPIVHEGSRSRILDIIKNTPYANREYPLYTRSIMPTKTVKYAIFLLNQNIVQLCYDITGRRRDLYGTMENLSHIFTTLSQLNYSQRDLHDETHTHPKQRLVVGNVNNSGSSSVSTNDQHNGCHNNYSDDYLSKSHSSVDIEHELPLLLPLPIDKMPATFLQKLQPSSESVAITKTHQSSGRMRLRACRSVGSYSDGEDDFKTLMQQKCYSNSDTNITLHRDT